MNKDQQYEYIQSANAVLKNSSIYISPARDSELQKLAMQDLENFLSHNRSIKAAAVNAGNEDFANLYLGIECALNALRAETSMWLLLKNDKPDAAWNELITAELATADAIRAHREFECFEDHVERLDTLEKTVFPPQVYFSVGGVVHHKLCSICEDDYSKCDHIIGKPYWGEICHAILKDVVPDHVSFVTEPANKLHRVTHFDDADGTRNRMTWKLKPGSGH